MRAVSIGERMSMLARRCDPWLATSHAQGCSRFEKAGNFWFRQVSQFLVPAAHDDLPWV
jgi:hypothetical protein